MQIVQQLCYILLVTTIIIVIKNLKPEYFYKPVHGSKASGTNMSIRGVNTIIDNLTESGYVTKVKEGRCNHYIVLPDRFWREKIVGECTIG